MRLRRGRFELLRAFVLAVVLTGCGPGSVQLPAGLPFGPGGATPPIPSETSVAGLGATTRAPVADVIDGDTLRVRIDGRAESVRIIGIDAPESVDPRRPVECFGREAAARAREMLSGQEVQLVPDRSQGGRDQYRRILAYVDLQDGRDFGLTMIAEGYAHESNYGQPYERQDSYRAAESQARDGRKGFWAPTTCGGDTQQPASDSDARRTSIAGEPAVLPPTSTAGSPAPTGATAIARTPGAASPPSSTSAAAATRSPAGSAMPGFTPSLTSSRTASPSTSPITSPGTTAPANRSATPLPTNVPARAAPTASPVASGTATLAAGTPLSGTPSRSVTASATARTTPASASATPTAARTPSPH